MFVMYFESDPIGAGGMGDLNRRGRHPLPSVPVFGVIGNCCKMQQIRKLSVRVKKTSAEGYWQSVPEILPALSYTATAL